MSTASPNNRGYAYDRVDSNGDDNFGGNPHGTNATTLPPPTPFRSGRRERNVPFPFTPVGCAATKAVIFCVILMWIMLILWEVHKEMARKG